MWVKPNSPTISSKAPNGVKSETPITDALKDFRSDFRNANGIDKGIP